MIRKPNSLYNNQKINNLVGSHGVNAHSHLRHKTVHGWMRMAVHDQMRMTVHGRCESSFTMRANTQLTPALDKMIKEHEKSLE